MSFARFRCNHISIAIGLAVASSTASASGIFRKRVMNTAF